MDYRPSVDGILQARIMELGPLPGDLPNPGTEPTSLMFPALAGGFFTTSTTWEAQGYIYSYINYIIYVFYLFSSDSLYGP